MRRLRLRGHEVTPEALAFYATNPLGLLWMVGG